MHTFLYAILFRKAGKPRRITRAILFRKNRTVRPIFHRVIHKKNGAVRPQWTYWVANASTANSLPQTSVPTVSDNGRAEAEALSGAEQALRQLRPFDRTVAEWQRAVPLPPLLSAEAILEQLAVSAPAGLVLACSHDNYREVPGGVQLCIHREEQAAVARGLAYLQFHPWQPLPCLAPVDHGENLPVTMLLNGTPIGTATMAALTTAVSQCVAEQRQVRLVVHHLLGHSPEALVDLARATQVQEMQFWVHDFFALCPSYTLLRNNLVFCGAPDAGSNACGLCVFGSVRTPHQNRIAALFQSLPVVAVAPSQVTADFWSAKTDLPIKELSVIPHLVIDERSRAAPKPIDTRRPITVGFLGGAAAHKGWPVFTEIMSRHSGPKMRFVVLSEKRPGQGEDDWQHVHVTAETPDAMSRAVERAKVDVVLHWASWPETFSFTTFEALSAGAWVLTNPGSGNVQAVVRATGHGLVLDDLAALDRFFADGSMDGLVAKRRAWAAQTEIGTRYSALSFDLPGWK